MLSYLKSAAAAVVTNVQQAATAVQFPPIQIGDRTVQIKEQLGEGGFAYVYSVEDVSTGELMAMKRMLCGEREAALMAEKEIAMLRQLGGSDHIIRMIGSTKKDNTQSSHRAVEYFILMELCSGGSLIDLIRRRNNLPLAETAVCDLFLQICQGVAHMHSQNPPIAHRDLKIENVLIDARGSLKLCDFGSCCTRAKAYTTSREIVEEEELIGKYSTQMYRAPEMADLYKKQLVNEKVDVWALGCILFTIAFFTQPFQDGGNLQILSGSYNVPESHSFSNYLTALIKRLLTIDPAKRPDIKQVIALVTQWRTWLHGGGTASSQPSARPASAAPGPSTAVTDPSRRRRDEDAAEKEAGAQAALSPQSAAPVRSKRAKIPKEKRKDIAPKVESNEDWANFGEFPAAVTAPAASVASTSGRSARASSSRRAVSNSSSDSDSSTDDEKQTKSARRPRAPSLMFPQAGSMIAPRPSAPAAGNRASAPVPARSPPVAAQAPAAPSQSPPPPTPPSTAMLFDTSLFAGSPVQPPTAVPGHTLRAPSITADAGWEATFSPAAASASASAPDDWTTFGSAPPPSAKLDEAAASSGFDSFDFSGFTASIPSAVPAPHATPPPFAAPSSAAASPSPSRSPSHAGASARREKRQQQSASMGSISVAKFTLAAQPHPSALTHSTPSQSAVRPPPAGSSSSDSSSDEEAPMPRDIIRAPSKASRQPR